ncbi:MAG: cache domain-containing protein [Candidatus Margulisbacteria bacterium]|nr:cache domain-containing protein [Candidatus Margulisiibacteriota bacterium]
MIRYLLLIPLILAGCAAPSPQYQHEETRSLVALVNDASQAVKNRGEKVFPEFRQPNSQWLHDNTYIFVLDDQGVRVVYPTAPDQEGKSLVNLYDMFYGKPIGKMILETALEDKGHSGWVHYPWPKPGEDIPSWKSSYVVLATAPSGKKYIVGSGLYEMKMEPQFVVEIVDEAAQLLEKEGQKAFATLGDQASKFYFKDTYVFILRLDDGVELLNPAYRQLEGKNVLDMKDQQGTYLVREMIKVAQTKGAGWVDYLWPKPGYKGIFKKSTYVRKAKMDGVDVLVGCGVYLD